jgi:glycine betaine/proline transport system permease protein
VFWFAALGDVIGLIMIARALWSSSHGVMVTTSRGGTALFLGFLFLIAFRAVTGLVANWAYLRTFIRWRSHRHIPTGTSWKTGLAGLGLLTIIYPLTAYRFSAPQVVEFIAKFPTTRFIKLKTAGAIDNMVDWMVIHLETFFDSITFGIRAVLNFLDLLFVGTPWPVTFLLIMLLAWRMAGPIVSMLSGLALLYVGLFGFWEKAMSTFSLVGAAMCLCIVLGAPLGIWCAKNRRLYTILRPILDMMQTIPSFVYLIPAVAFFSIGKPPGILATIVFAMPPLIRLTALGIMQVPHSVREAAIAFGASPRQLLFKVEIPLAIPSIMTGINQSIMMSLSMVVVAALIGAGGLGYDVLFALQHVEAGNGILAGLAIAILAMVLDRIVQGSQKGIQRG